MATIINNPSTGSSDSSGVVMVFGVVVALLFVGLFFVYALPALRGGDAEPKTDIIKVEIPNPVTPTPTPAN